MPTAPETLAQTTESSVQNPEITEKEVGFLANTRQKIAEELKLSFTLPDPREEGIGSTVKNLWLKGSGLAGIVAGKYIFGLGEADHIQHTPGETEQTIHEIKHAVEGVGVGTALLGAFSIYLANRIRTNRNLI